VTRLDTVTKSRSAECAQRGPLSQKLEAEEQAATAPLEQARVDVKAEAAPPGSGARHQLRIVQAGAMVALCLFAPCSSASGGTDLAKPASGPPEASTRPG
jgi:hypothetical protein